MCGIFGYHGRCYQDIDKAVDVITHRGPDDRGVEVFCELEFSMGMRRLSIVDLDGGYQPMWSADRKFCVVYNGEVFNADLLREELVEKGFRFYTKNSDTEVLLHLYEAEGERMVHRLNGMFAFVILDLEKRVLFGVRDPIGIKPLFFSKTELGFIFASEIKSILEVPGFDRSVSSQAISDFLTFLAPQQERSIYQNVERLKPGHCFHYSLDSAELDVASYWKLFDSFASVPTEDNLNEWIWDLFKDAVSRWMISDVPVGFSLSGGLDSSATVAAAYELGQTNINTFTLGFVGETGSDIDETQLAREVSSRFDTEHHEILINPDDLLDELPQMVWALDEPYAGGIPSWWVFKGMGEHVKVAMTGSGGDELFGNYGHALLFEGNSAFEKWERLRHRIPSSLLRRMVKSSFFAGLLNSKEENVSRLRHLLYPASPFLPATCNYFSQLEKSNYLLEKNVIDDLSPSEVLMQSLLDECPSDEFRDKIAYLAFATQLPEEFLFMTDRFSMAHSVEARVPFLDKVFVEKMMSIDAMSRTGLKNPKSLFKSVINGRVPESVIKGKKRGFVIPYEKWVWGDLKPLIRRLCDPVRLKKQGIFVPDFLEKYGSEGRRETDPDQTMKLWIMFMFQLWYFIHIENKGKTVSDLSDLN